MLFKKSPLQQLTTWRDPKTLRLWGLEKRKWGSLEIFLISLFLVLFIPGQQGDSWRRNKVKKRKAEDGGVGEDIIFKLLCIPTYEQQQGEMRFEQTAWKCLPLCGSAGWNSLALKRIWGMLPWRWVIWSPCPTPATYFLWHFWRGKVKFLHNLLLLLPLYLSLLLAKSGSRRSRSLRKWGLTMLGTGAYLMYPCLALYNCPAPANLLNHACL